MRIIIGLTVQHSLNLQYPTLGSRELERQLAYVDDEVGIPRPRATAGIRQSRHLTT